jgi:hypothetical protein
MRRSNIFICSFAVAVLALSGCGDDSATDSGADIGVDTGPGIDTGPGMDSGRPDSAPRPDVGTDAGLPVAECDPFAADACAADEKCALVIYNADAMSMTDNVIFYGCVSNDSGLKGRDVVCDRSVELSPGNPDDTFFTSDCAGGFFCWTTLDDGFERCRSLCGFGDAPDCADEAEFCLTINGDPAIAVCNPLSDCDPVTQIGCDALDACYVVNTTQGDRAARCFTEPTADDAGVPPPGRGDPCMFLNSCRGGNGCSGEILADGGVGDTALCRRYCEALADGGVTDAGMDAGVPPGCMGVEACVGLPALPDGGMSILPGPTGFCQ